MGGRVVGSGTRREDSEVGAEVRVEELWLALALVDWSSVVVVPADPAGTTAALASALAEVGARLSLEPVSALRLEIDHDPRVAADLQQILRRDRSRNQLARLAPHGAPGRDQDEQQLGDEPTARSGKTIVSIPAVTRDPLGVAVAQAADAVVVTLALGRTRVADARRTIELIGRERIVGCFVVS